MIVWTITEAARYLKVNPATVRRALTKGQIPGRKVGRSWRLVKEDLDEYLKGQVIGQYENTTTGQVWPIRSVIQDIH